ncbi:MAG: 3-keto-disaccharide hydrolase [Candidatus Zhuqueibacterota bacterium]
MTYLKTSILFFLLIIVLSSCGQKTAHDNWTILFDGNSTDAWRAFHRDTFPTEGWKIEDGALKTIVGGDAVDIITKDQFSNFELELEWKVSPGGNSGIFFGVSEQDNSVWQSGVEMQVLDDNLHHDGQNPKTSAGSLYALIAPQNKALQPVGEFNKARLVVKDNHAEHWLNGVKIVEYTLGSDTLSALIADSKFKDLPSFGKVKIGHIALQHHGEEVWYRNIRVRPL